LEEVIYEKGKLWIGFPSFVCVQLKLSILIKTMLETCKYICIYI
jgi:hypothetical protein